MTVSTRALGAKVRARLIIPAIVFMLVSSLDRVNVSFAALKMNADLGMSPSQYGFGAGILFVGFLLGQYPSVLTLQRVGLKTWLSASVIIWGLCAAAMAFVTAPWQFYVLRVILGFAEGGLAPGLVLYLGQWASERERATTFAMPMLAVPLSIVLGGPVSGWFLSMTPPLDIASWRWMFLGEAIPNLILGVAAFFYFPNGPKDSRWLSDEERAWLKDNAANAEREKPVNDWAVLRQPLVWSSALLWFCLLAGSYGIMFWLPQMIRSLAGLTPLEIGFVNALPFAGLALGIYFNSAHSDKTGERFWHVGLPAAVGGAAVLAALALGPSVAGLIALFVLGTALGAAQGAFWALPTKLMSREAMAVGVVAINMAGSSAGAFVPNLMGQLRESTGGFTAPTLLVAGVLFAGAALVAMIRLVFFKPARA